MTETEASSRSVPYRPDRPVSDRIFRLVSMVVLLSVVLAGCEEDEPEVDPRVAERHAATRAVQEARLTAVVARQLVLLHPESRRQQQARDQLLYFREHSGERLPTDAEREEKSSDTDAETETPDGSRSDE